MDILNQIFIQLREADRYARSSLPQERRLAVVLFDNLVELQLRRRAELDFLFDRTTWYSGVRKHNRRTRRRVLRYHPELVQFAADRGWISIKDGVFLSYAHRIRNSYYHSGEYDELDSEIAIQLFHKFIRAKFPDWKTARGILSLGASYWDEDQQESITCPGHERIQWGFEHQLERSDPFSDEYWEKGIGHLLTHKPPKPLASLISEKLTKLLDEIERSLDFIQRDGKDLDWNHVLADYSVITGWFCYNIENNKPITNLNAVLNIYMVISRHEEELLDITDADDRNDKFFEYLNAHDYDPEVLPKDRIAQYRNTARKLRRGREAKAVSTYLKTESELREISKAIQACARDLDGWIQHQFDLARGK